MVGQSPLSPNAALEVHLRGHLVCLSALCLLGQAPLPMWPSKLLGEKEFLAHSDDGASQGHSGACLPLFPL